MGDEQYLLFASLMHLSSALRRSEAGSRFDNGRLAVSCQGRSIDDYEASRTKYQSKPVTSRLGRGALSSIRSLRAFVV